MDTLIQLALHPMVLMALAFGSALGSVTFLASAGARRSTRAATTLMAFFAAFASMLQFV